MNNVLFSHKNFGKCIMEQHEWENKKCHCGGELILIENNEYEEVKECKDCGERSLFFKKIRNDLKGDLPPFDKLMKKRMEYELSSMW